MTEREVFEAALELLPGDRAAFLDGVCGGDAALRQRLEALLCKHDQAGSFLEEPVLTGAFPAEGEPKDKEPQDAAVGQVLAGRYKLLEAIGEGGMGTVWMAQQNEPVKRLVAVKLIKTGMDSKQVLARFAAEGQALALMDHPSIAKVHDAGTTPDGRPFFVMELVKGVPLTKFSDEHKLTPRQRLELFVPVCQAIQHAHQKGIIHRDLKPSNVLVAMYDDKPVPKVIDFGVAKATGQQLTEQTLHTGFGAIIGTVEYMSPEQASFNQLDVDTRSDVYSLGVLLYELLAGSPPFSRKDLETAGMMEMLRVIREQEPSKPSTKLSTAEGLPTLAANRGTEPAKLTKLVRGELDWIVMKALEKDRNRRYETANGFAMDVQRYLADETVQACPPSARYRLRKFAQRNGAALLTIAVVVGALMAGTLVSTWQAIRATHAEGLANQRFQAEKQARNEADVNLQKAREAGEEFFNQVSESRLLDESGLQPLRKELLEAAASYYERLATREGDDPRALTDLALSQLRLAQIYQHTGFGDRHIAALEEGIKRAEKLITEHPDAADQHRRLAGFWYGGRHVGGVRQAPTDKRSSLHVYQNAAELWEKLCQRYTNVVGFQSDLSKFYDSQAGAQEAMGHLDEAVRTEKRVCEIRAQIVRAHPGVYEHVAELGHACVYLARLLETTDPQAAEDLFRRGLDLQKDAPDVATYQEFLATQQRAFGEFLARRDRPEEAIAAYRRAIAVYQNLLARFPHVTNYREGVNAWQGEISKLQGRSGKRQEKDLGEQLHEKAIALLNGLTADDAPAVLFAAAKLYRQAGDAHLAERETDKAVGAYDTSIRVFDKLSAEFPNVPSYRSEMASCCQQRGQLLYQNSIGKPQEVEAAFREAQAHYEKLVKECPDEPGYRIGWADSHTWLAWALMETQRWEEVENALRRALAIRQELLALAPADPVRRLIVVHSHLHLGASLVEAECLSRFQQRRPPSHTLLAAKLGDVRRFQEAEQEYRQCLDVCEKLLVEFPDNPAYQKELAVSHYFLGGVLAARGRGAESARMYRQSVAGYTIFLQQTPGTAIDWFLLAAAYSQLGEKEQARPWYDRAVEWLEKNQSQDAEVRRLHAEGAQLLGLPVPARGGNVSTKEEMKPPSK